MKKLISIVLALTLALGLTATAWANEPVTYLDKDGNSQTCISYTEITEDNKPTTWGKDGDETWYVVKGDVTIDSMTIQGGANVNLILMDGKTLTVNGNIDVGSHGSSKTNLTIYGQSGQTGKLICKGAMNIFPANGIDSSMTLNGCTVDVGGGITLPSGSTSVAKLTVNGGKLSVTNSSDDAIRIVGYWHAPGTMTINGGTVIAKSTATGGRAINRDNANPNSEWDYTLGSFNLPTTTYWWRTTECGNFTASSTSEYNKESTASYVEITTVEPVAAPPADEPEPDEEPAVPGHEPIRRQHVTAVEDPTPDTDTKADEAKTDTVTSAKTFDTGVAVYGAMAVASLLGMGYVEKKRV